MKESKGPIQNCSGAEDSCPNAKWWYGVLFVILLIASGIVRTVNLAEYPLQIHNDESATGIAIRVFLTPNGPWALKGSSFGGHPNFGFWLSSIPSQLAGEITLWNIRFASAVMGVMSIVLMALAVKLAFGGRAALLFLVFAAPYHLHVHYSRTAFAYNHALLAGGLFFWSFVRFGRYPSRINATLVGASVGVCMLVYAAAHVLPPATVAAFVMAALIKKTRGMQINQSVAKCLSLGAFMLLGFLIVFGPQLHEWIFHGYSSRASTQMIFSPGSRKHLEASVGHKLTEWELISNSFWQTWKFFYREDSAGQYSFRTRPIDLVGAALALCGLIVLCVRAIKGNMMALLSVFAAILTVAGSMMMVEANFSPHFVLFALLTPFAMAVGLETILQLLVRGRAVWTFIIALAVGSWWSWWNFNYYQRNMENSSRGRHVWLLHLPIDTFSVRSITNFSAQPEDLGESFFELIYPGSKRANRPTADAKQVAAAIAQDRAAGLCPCLAVVQSELSGQVTESLRSEGVAFEEFSKTFYNSALNSSALLVR